MDKLNDTTVLYNIFSLYDDSGDISWRPFKPGIEICPLYNTDRQDGFSAALLRYAPGAEVPYHEHMGYEHIIILSGSQSDENGVYPQGTLLINPVGSRHGVKSETGCIALGIWEKPVKFL